MDELTIDEVRAIVDKIVMNCRASGKELEVPTLAQVVIQPLKELWRRLDKPTILYMLYFRNEGARDTLPPLAMTIAKQVYENQLSVEDARDKLTRAIEMYDEVFKQLDISAQAPKTALST